MTDLNSPDAKAFSVGKERVKLNVVGWFDFANPDKTFEQAVADLRAQGNEILEIDEANQSIKVLDTSQWVYECDKCKRTHPEMEVVLKHEETCNG